jgi:hypothetical protein
MSTTFLVPKNNANSKLAAAITAVAASLTVLTGEGARFPSTYPFHISIDSEILQVTNRSSDTFTVVRAQESTSAATHKAGANVQLNITAKAISDLNSAVNTVEEDIATIQEDIDDLETAPPAHATSHQNEGSDELNVDGLSGELADPQTPLDHATSHQDEGSDELKLDDLAEPDDNTDLDASIAKHGLCPKFPDDPALYLNGIGSWTEPETSGGVLFLFGDGSDGDVTISGDITLTRDMMYNTLTVNGGVTLTTGGYRVFVKGTLTNNGTISRKGNNGSGHTGGTALAEATLGASIAGATHAYGGGGGGSGGGIMLIVAFTLTNNGTITAAGGNGGTGAAGTGSAGNAGGTSSPSDGGGAGNGGSVTGYAGGTGGAATASGVAHHPTLIIHWLKSATLVKGGAGGGCGASKTGAGGGGGGGGGGAICLVYAAITAGTLTVAGGAAGSGVSETVAATAGSAGNLYQLLISV